MASPDSETIETLQNTISADEFFKKYILKRKPVKFSFVLDELKEAATKWKDNDYLKPKAGKTMIHSEVRNSLNDKFGIASKQKMQFDKFLDALTKNKEEKYYLTVQEIETNEFGPKLLYTSPLNEELMSDIPFKPSILKHLELYQINVWIGHSIHGTSSKLHHDYHDNLYTVIRGKKQFEIFPPKSVHSLYVNGHVQGKLCQVFDNGLIAYDRDFREDGASKISVQKWQNTHKNNNSNDSVNSSESDDLKEDNCPLFDDAEIEMDEDEQLLDQLLKDKMERMQNDEEESFDDEDDDYNALLMHEMQEPNAAHEASDLECVSEPPLKKRKLNHQSGSGEDDQKNVNGDPLSFSQIDLKEDESVILAKYPKYKDVCHLKQVITVNEGEMLYLPAGWFHDVTSFSNAELNSHFALNYWMHPPLATGTTQQPYCDEFWRQYNQKTFKQMQ